jgi:hypothetical protein
MLRFGHSVRPRQKSSPPRQPPLRVNRSSSSSVLAETILQWQFHHLHDARPAREPIEAYFEPARDLSRYIYVGGPDQDRDCIKTGRPVLNRSMEVQP